MLCVFEDYNLYIVAKHVLRCAYLQKKLLLLVAKLTISKFDPSKGPKFVVTYSDLLIITILNSVRRMDHVSVTKFATRLRYATMLAG